MTKLRDAAGNQKRRALFRSQSGQGMTEYILIVVLIAVAAIVVVRTFGDKIKGLFQKSAETIESGTKGAFGK
ncbi:hypothetical protein AUJ66_01565 [Candidatus Desantisbacteria bacterium CG1_02_38_46]|uniref:Uncharacterized protein n=1 Tax=Candidatus Desantisbacteria bacterium CG1_02_38_46 TaxID=1817893 RepID=A0A1J4SF53_9BACT|nr:MAG: hypothetical protein AUJ66_01565 [Candidatus Desantisbacteria bacterium CG1_02_38_46]